MLDPRIYRTGLVAVALAVIVLAFSLDESAGAADHDAGAGGIQRRDMRTPTMNRLAEAVPQSPAGTPADRAIADAGRQAPVSATGLRSPATRSRVRPPTGRRTLENVVGVRPGTDHRRDRGGRPSRRARLARDRGGVGHRACSRSSPTSSPARTHHRTIVLASTSGSSGAAGARRAGRRCPQPVDAVVVLGDMAGRRRPPAGRRAVVERPGGRTAACCATRSPPRSRSRPGCRRAPRASGPVRAPRVPVHGHRAGPFGAQGEPGRAAVGLGRPRRPGRRRVHERGPDHRRSAARVLESGDRARGGRTCPRRRPTSVSLRQGHARRGRSGCSSWR